MFSGCDEVDLLCGCLEWESEGSPYRETRKTRIKQQQAAKSAVELATRYRASLHAEMH